MLTKFIRELFEPLIEGLLWLSLLGAFIGLALIIVDIRNTVKKIEERQSHREAEN